MTASTIDLAVPRDAASPPAARTPLALRAPGWAWLLAGAVATVLVGARWNVGALAWIAPVPFLLHLRAGRGWRARLALLAVLPAAVTLQTMKMITAPLHPALALLFGVPIGLALWAVYVGWDAIRRRAGEGWALYAFPALLALAEVAGYRLTELGIWGASATTQLESLPLLQLASLLGISAIAFVMGWAASLVALLLSSPEPRRWTGHAVALGVALAAVLAHGSIRLFATQGRTVTVAGVVADLGPGPEGLPDRAALDRNAEALFARSSLAADRGARLVVWNEGATVVEKAGEPAFVERGARLARERGIDLVLAYVVPLSARPFRFENRYVWISQDGEVLERYDKHHPVPGEGSVRGTEPLRAHARPWGVAAGAICYDYDFPAMALGHARLGAGLVALPASDWKGIDPYHSQMARLRAIEGGFSVVRPVRWATSMAFDAYGRTRGALPWFEENERVLLASVPVEPVATLYARIGDSAALGYAAYLALAIAVAIRGRRGPPLPDPLPRFAGERGASTPC